MSNINRTLINEFLRKAEEVDRLVMSHALNISSNVKILIRDYNVSNDELCKRLEIKPNKLKSFLDGTYNYTIKDISILNAMWIEFSDKNKNTKTE